MMVPAQSAILINLHKFLAGASKNSRICDLELTQTALLLLKTLPPSRDAVLEYVCVVFDSAVNKYAIQAQNDQLMNAPTPMSVDDEQVIGEVHQVLCSFLTASSKAWAPIISSWSLKLLGRLSSRYGASYHQGSLNEAIHWWMSCKAVRILVDITTQCFQCLIDSDAETCVSSLFDTSVTHSPYFDWVVALLGTYFSKTVITRVLSLGLKDFVAQNGNSGVNKVGNLKSVVGILGHLGVGHFPDIRTALLGLFMWSLEPGPDLQLKRAVGPFIMMLSSQSSTILNAVSIDIVNKLDDGLLETLPETAVHWKSYYGEAGDASLEDLAIVLALRCNRGGAKIISLLLDGASSETPSISSNCRLLMELLLAGIESGLDSDRTPVPLINSLANDVRQLSPLLLSEDPFRQSTLCRLLRLIGKVNASVPIEAACCLLQKGHLSEHMSTLMMLVEHSYSSSNLLEMALEQTMRQCNRDVWKNLCTLLNISRPGARDLVSSAVKNNLGMLSTILSSNEIDLTNSVMEVMDNLSDRCLSGLYIQLQLRLVTACVKYVFASLQLEDEVERSIRGRRVRSVLESICLDSAAARAAVLRELIEASFFLPPAELFGSRRRKIQRLTDTQYSLTEDNLKLRVTNGLSGRQSSAFGNSVVLNTSGNLMGLPTPDRIQSNMMHFIETLKSCSTTRSVSNPNDRVVSMDAAVQTALLLVSLISPDVMYNGLPWPEEDFSKVTIERDIHIRKIFDELPLAWRILEMLALQQPALCYCSVLLRALMATLLSQWGSPSVSNRPAVLDSTLRLLTLMCVGQLLPPPLTALHQVIPLLSPQEVLYLLRSCVWNYMRDNVPSPALFCPDLRSGFMWRDVSVMTPPTYTEPLRMVLLQNMHHFGSLYLQLFVHSQ